MPRMSSAEIPAWQLEMERSAMQGSMTVEYVNLTELLIQQQAELMKWKLVRGQSHEEVSVMEQT